MRHVQRTALVLLLSLSAPAATSAEADEPFGRPAVETAPGPLQVTWRRIRDELKSERDVVAGCRSAPASCASPAAKRFIAIVREGAGHDDTESIGRINRAVNLAIKPARPGSGPTAWTSPLNALTTGTGDCKQYTVVKYAALLDAGLSPDRVRLVSVRLRRPPVSTPPYHAVTAVRVHTRWLVLDNRSLTVRESKALLDDMEPLFTLDDRGVRQFVAPSVIPIVAASPCSDSHS